MNVVKGVIGSGGTTMLRQVSAKVKEVAQSVLAIETATVQSDELEGNQTVITLDSDPNQLPVTARSAIGTYEQGARVFVLKYPPNGLLIIGRNDDYLRLNSTGDASVTSTGHALQIGPTAGLNIRIDNNEILAVNNGSPNNLNINPDGFGIRVNGSTASADATTSSVDHPLQLGPTGGENLRLDANEILALNNGSVSTLYLQNDGGTVEVGNNSTTNINWNTGTATGARVRVTATDDLSPTSTDHGFQVGLSNSLNIGMDNNEIMARNNGATSQLNINISGGNVAMGDSSSTITTVGNHEFPNAPTTAAGANVNFNAGLNNRIRLVTSSIRFKDNVRDLKMGVRKLLALTPRTFNRNDDLDDEGNLLPVTSKSPRYTGFIAEEARDLGLSGWLHLDADGEPIGFAYDQWSVALQYICRSQQDEIDELRARIEALEAGVDSKKLGGKHGTVSEGN